MHTRSKGKNLNMPNVIDRKRVYDAYEQLINNQITQDQFYQIFNPFNNLIDQMVHLKKNYLGPKQKTLLNFRNDLVNATTTSMHPLKDKKDDQLGEGLKMLTPQQMLKRLPISLAQLQAGNNSQKLKNEVRQLLYSLYRSKTINKLVYNNLINTI